MDNYKSQSNIKDNPHTKEVSLQTYLHLVLLAVMVCLLN